MANSKISALTSATTPLAGTETLPIVQNSTTKQVSVANLTAGRTQTSNGIVQGTAATGYNFTANTPASGMTSQLLNWYEEGTWTATDQSGAGLTFTANRTATYIRIGSQVTAWFDITFPANASGASSTISLPIKNGPTHDASVCWGYITYATAITGDVIRNQSYFQPCTLGGANVTNAALTGVRMIGTAIYTTI